MLPAILILLVFAVAAGLMFTRKMPALLALPAMACLIAIISGVSAGLPWMAGKGEPSLTALLFDNVMTAGPAALVNTMVLAIFGSILSQVVMRQGIAQRIVRVAAEYAGDRKLLLAFLLTAAVAVNFASLTGLGPVIMLGSLVLPVMVGSGLSSTYSASLMLFGIAIGGMVNPANLQPYSDLLHLEPGVTLGYAVKLSCLFSVVAIAYLVIEGRKQTQRFSWAAPQDFPGKQVPVYALFTPILPLVILLPFSYRPMVPAFCAAILYGCLSTEPRRLFANLTACMLKGLKEISPVLGLFMGIGMAYKAMTDPTTVAIMDPLIKAVVPTSPTGYVLFFTLLAPLTLYRGPLNLYGLGAGFMVLLANSKMLPPLAIMAAFLSTGQVQSVCDPTNTANVWMAQFLQDSTDKFLKSTLAYVWIFVLLALGYAVSMGVMS